MAGRKFKENTPLEEVLKHPRAALVLRQHGIPCPTCPLARLEMGKLKIGDVARMYNVDLERLLEALNKAVKEEAAWRCSCC